MLDLDRTGRVTGPQVHVDRVRSGHGSLPVRVDRSPRPVHQWLHRVFRSRMAQVHTNRPRLRVLVFVFHRMGLGRHAGLHGNHLLRRECLQTLANNTCFIMLRPKTEILRRH